MSAAFTGVHPLSDLRNSWCFPTKELPVSCSRVLSDDFFSGFVNLFYGGDASMIGKQRGAFSCQEEEIRTFSPIETAYNRG
jgi:hypothetical protein